MQVLIPDLVRKINMGVLSLCLWICPHLGHITAAQSTGVYCVLVSTLVVYSIVLYKRGPHSNPTYKFPVFSLFFPGQVDIFLYQFQKSVTVFISKTDFVNSKIS